MLSGGKVVVFDMFVAIFGQKCGFFSQKFWGEYFLLSKFVFGYFKTKKRKTCLMAGIRPKICPDIRYTNG